MAKYSYWVSEIYNEITYKARGHWPTYTAHLKSIQGICFIKKNQNLPIKLDHI